MDYYLERYSCIRLKLVLFRISLVILFLSSLFFWNGYSFIFGEKFIIYYLNLVVRIIKFYYSL